LDVKEDNGKLRAFANPLATPSILRGWALSEGYHDLRDEGEAPTKKREVAEIGRTG